MSYLRVCVHTPRTTCTQARTGMHKRTHRHAQTARTQTHTYNLHTHNFHTQHITSTTTNILKSKPKIASSSFTPAQRIPNIVFPTHMLPIINIGIVAGGVVVVGDAIVVIIAVIGFCSWCCCLAEVAVVSAVVS